MKFTEEIFARATLKGVADYLLFGLRSDKDNRDYEARLEESYLKFEKVAMKYSESESSNLLDLANAMTSDTAEVYMEIGMQAAILLMNDVSENIGCKEQGRGEKADYQTMYQILFKSITFSLEFLQESEEKCVKKACEILKKGQCRCEEIYIDLK